MWKSRDNERLAGLAVLAAAAREADELLQEPDLPVGARAEAQRRLESFREAVGKASR